MPALALPEIDNPQDPVDDLAVRPLALRDTSELRVGPDGRPFVFDLQSGRVVALHGPGRRIVELLDGTYTMDGLYGLFGVDATNEDDPRRRALTDFVRGLDDSGMLRDATPVADTGMTLEVEHIPTDMPPGWKLRLHLPIAGESRVDSADQPIGSRTGAALLIALVTGLVGHLLVARALIAEVPDFASIPERTPGMLALIIPIMLIQIAFHEAAHAFVLRLFGLPTSEVGLRFWFYVMPLPYVSQSAEVFLPQRRQRLTVSLAGIVMDGITAILILAVLMPIAGTPVLISWALFHLMVLQVNCNPLLPTDGARAVEAVLSEVSLRQRSVRWARAKVMRRPAPAGSPTTIGKQIYGVASLIFVLLVVCTIVVQVVAGIAGGAS